MDLHWELYHRLNVILLSAIGLWPYGNKFVLRAKLAAMSVCLFCCCFSQLATFFTVDYTTKLLLRNAPYMFIGFGISLKYFSCLAAGNSIKKVTEAMDVDWKDLSSKEELRIMEKYAERSKFHTKGFAMFICPAALCLSLLPLSSVFLDIVVPLNETRNYSLPIMLEVFFDKQKYFFLIAILFDGTMIAGALVFVSTETLVMVYIQHACALFEVTSCRIKKLLCAAVARDPTRTSNVLVIAPVIEIHSRAIRHCKILKDDFIPPYLILLLFAIMSLSAYLFHCTQTFATNEYTEFLASGMFCIAALGYMFYLNFVSQNLLDSSLSIFDDLYDSEWYEFPASTRKLILICMMSSVKPIAMDLCGLFRPSYEGFSLIVRMATSYATALYSFQ